MQIKPFKYPVEQCEPPRPAGETLPTMYDLPSENRRNLACLTNSMTFNPNCCA
jgi:hypothetical protein